jgi:hypothetical protein
MGSIRSAKCRDCGHADFEVRDGGGLCFGLLRCDSCGQTKQVAHPTEPAARTTRLTRPFRRKSTKQIDASPFSQPRPEAKVDTRDFSAGDWVTVTDGPLVECTASVRLVDTANKRIHVAVFFLGEELTTEELGFDQVKLIDDPCKCGGTFLDFAPVRCPRCQSTSVEMGRVKRFID